MQEAVALSGPAFDQHVLDFVVSAMAQALDSFGSLNSAVLFVATARACGPFDQTTAPKRPVSINALASAIGRPFETTRRHAIALIERGLIVRSPNGLSVTPDAIVDPRVARFAERCHDLLVRLVEDLGKGGFALPSTGNDGAYDPRCGVGIALDLILAAMESHGPREENFTRLALLLAVEWCLCRRAHACPDGISEPVTRTSDAARVLGLPYATASRNIDMLVDCGLLTRSGPILHPVADAPLAVAASTALNNRARQLLGRLAQCGFPMEGPGTAYIRGRAPLPDLA